MIPASNSGEPNHKKPKVMEIVGLAGAGKTTLYKALGNYPELLRLCRYPKVNKIKDAPFFIRYGLRLLPSIFRLYSRPSRQLSQREFAWLTILEGWPFILQKDVKQIQQSMIMDQGPVYLLAELREFGPEFLMSEKAEKFWQKIYCRWASTLDFIVWLDAEDTYLMERINLRAKKHLVKHEPEPVVLDFLVRFRRAYENVVSMLGNCTNGPRVLRFNTHELRPEEIVTHLLSEIGLT
jgi:hypothetical protein